MDDGVVHASTHSAEEYCMYDGTPGGKVPSSYREVLVVGDEIEIVTQRWPYNKTKRPIRENPEGILRG